MANDVMAIDPNPPAGCRYFREVLGSPDAPRSCTHEQRGWFPRWAVAFPTHSIHRALPVWLLPSSALEERKRMKTSTQKQNAAAKAAQTNAARQAVTREQIEKRAHEIFIERGQETGRDLDDWLQAERELQGGNHPPGKK